MGTVKHTKARISNANSQMGQGRAASSEHVNVVVTTWMKQEMQNKFIRRHCKRYKIASI